MKKLNIIFFVSILLLLNCNIFSKEESAMKELLNDIKTKNITEITQRLGDSVSVGMGHASLGQINKKNNYDGFSEGKGYLHALFFNTKKARQLTTMNNLFSLKDFIESSDKIKYNNGIEIVRGNDKYSIVIANYGKENWYIQGIELEFDIPEELLKLDME